ncbi:MAG: S-layer homology domain-containing protein [Phormidesmis sp.]
MTQSPIPPENNNDERRNTPATGPLRPLEFDEMVALFVAFLSLGGVLFWGLTRSNASLFSDTPLLSGPVLTEPRADEPEALTDAGTEESLQADSALNPAAALADEDDPEDVSAVSQLSARAAARRERLAARKPIWEDMRDGMVGAAAGVAGVTATTDSATAALDADSTDAAIETEPPAAETEVPDIGAIIPTPSEAATAPPQDAIVFNDVPEDHWAVSYIDALSSRDLISGYDDGTFKPDQPVTRSQIANIVSRTFDLTADKETLEFTDVAADYWARESIGEVVRGGFMTGFPNDEFQPNQPVTRAQALTTLVTGLGIEAPTNVQATLDRYDDANAIPNWANEKMAAATAGSLVVNYPAVAQLNPTQPTTRAELAAMIYQALVREDIVDAVESEYVVKP